jgi:hypothetical protein
MEQAASSTKATLDPNLPAEHDMQEFCPGWGWNFPKTHWLHALPAAVKMSAELLPAGQSVHIGDAPSANLPAEQDVHVADRAVDAYFPEGQSLQVGAFSIVPEYFPTEQDTQPDCTSLTLPPPGVKAVTSATAIVTPSGENETAPG